MGFLGKVSRNVRKIGKKIATSSKIGARKLVNTSHQITKGASKAGKLIKTIGDVVGNKQISNLGSSISSTSDRVRAVTNSADRAGQSIERAVRSGKKDDISDAFEGAKGLAKHFE